MTKAPVNNLLLTGLPGCGKTTVVRRVVERLPGRRLAGFYTEEIRREGRRLGFDAIGLGGRRAVLAHVELRTKNRVGRYGVDVAAFNSVVEAELRTAPDDVDLFMIDEIGKMECFSRLFVEAATVLLDSEVPVLATIALKGGGFIREVKARPDVELLTVTAANRGDLPDRLVQRLGGE